MAFPFYSSILSLLYYIILFHTIRTGVISNPLMRIMIDYITEDSFFYIFFDIFNFTLNAPIGTIVVC